MKVDTAFSALMIVVAVTAPRPALAQSLTGARLGLASVAPVSPFRQSRDTVIVRPNEWKRGMIVGGIVGALFGTALYEFERIESDTRTSPFVIIGPTIIFSLIGGMIGASHPRN